MKMEKVVQCYRNDSRSVFEFVLRCITLTHNYFSRGKVKVWCICVSPIGNGEKKFTSESRDKKRSFFVFTNEPTRNGICEFCSRISYLEFVR